MRAAGLVPVPVRVDAAGAVIERTGRRGRGAPHRRAPVPRGRPAQPGPAARGGRVGRAHRWARDRGRLRRRVPLRPTCGRRAPGARAPPRALRRHRVEEPRTRRGPRVGGRARAPARADLGATAAHGRHLRRAEPADPRAVHRRARLRPQRAPAPRRVPGHDGSPSRARVADDLPGCRITGLAAGLHCLLELPPATSETQVTEAAERLGLRFDGLASYRLAGSEWRHPPAMVVGYGAPPSHRFDEAIDVAIRAVRSVGTV